MPPSGADFEQHDAVGIEQIVQMLRVAADVLHREIRRD
jgi:hypothetical protein